MIPPALAPADTTLESASPLGSGHIHGTYLASYSDGSRLVHQRVNTEVFPETEKVMENLVTVTSHVRSRTVGPDAERRVLTPVAHAGSCHLFSGEEGQVWRTFHFIPHTVSYDVAPSTTVATEVARTFGIFQAHLASLDPGGIHEHLPGFHCTPERLAAFHEALEADPLGRAAALAEILPSLRRLAPLAPTLTSAGLPLRVIHYDTKINNVLLDATTGEGLCVVDLDTLMPGFVPYDFGDLVRSASNPAAEDETDLAKVGVDLGLFAAIARGYLRGCGDQLGSDERAALPVSGAVIAYELALRFLTDYLLGDPYFATARPGHNLDRGRAQLRLAESFQENLSQLETIVARA